MTEVIATGAELGQPLSDGPIGSNSNTPTTMTPGTGNRGNNKMINKGSPSKGTNNKHRGGKNNKNHKNHNNGGNKNHPSSSVNNTNNNSEKAGVVVIPKDENLPPNVKRDPRGDDPTKRIVKRGNKAGSGGRNTASFDPKSTLIRPALRVKVGSGSQASYTKPLKHDDVVIVPELFGDETDYTMYYKLIEELTELQNKNVKRSEWISWHEGAHLIAKDPSGSPTFNKIIDRLCEYFHIRKASIGTRFNWYKDSSDWKPFHHDSAAFNAQRAQNQNITVGVSFGAQRELAFLLAADEANNNNKDKDNKDCRLYFPQPNNGVFSFGRDVNIRWKHGINALPVEEQQLDGTGRVSIILWGLCDNVIEESNSPPMLGADGKGPHASKNNNKYYNKKTNHHNNYKQNGRNYNGYNRNTGGGGGGGRNGGFGNGGKEHGNTNHNNGSN